MAFTARSENHSSGTVDLEQDLIHFIRENDGSVSALVIGCFMFYVCFMFPCTLYDTLRNKFLMKSLKKYFFDDLDVKLKILFLFNNVDPFICKSVAAFIFEIMNCQDRIM